MSGDETIRISGQALREAAQHHQEAADYLQTVPNTHPQIEGFLSSLGPIFGGFRAASLELLDQRRTCYEQQARDHQQVTAGLNQSAAQWDNHEAGGAQQMRGLLDS